MRLKGKTLKISYGGRKFHVEAGPFKDRDGTKYLVRDLDGDELRLEHENLLLGWTEVKE